MLAEVEEPLVLADGTKIDPSTGKVIKDKLSSFFAVPSPSEAQALVVRARKSVADLPMPPQQMSGVGLVAFYTLFGLNDTDIALALDSKITVEQVKEIKKCDAYLEFMNSAKENILNTETETVRDVFQQHAKGAAMKIVELADGDNDVLSFKASQDILDRAGHRPADVVEHRHRMEDNLNIVITRRDETVQLPTVDADFVEINK
jgi:hypothetical protein